MQIIWPLRLFLDTQMNSSDSASKIELPLLTPAVLEACSFQNWYHSFSQHTFRSTIITLDPSHVDYLRDTSHGLHLPKELAPPSRYIFHGRGQFDWNIATVPLIASLACDSPSQLQEPAEWFRGWLRYWTISISLLFELFHPSLTLLVSATDQDDFWDDRAIRGLSLPQAELVSTSS